MAKKVIVFGSCNLDIFFDVPNMEFFNAPDILAENAMHFSTHVQAPGGKGANQAVAAAKAGAKVHLFGAVGRGSHSRYLIEKFKESGIEADGVVSLDAPTGLAIVLRKPDGKFKLLVSQGANMLAKSKQVPDELLGPDSILLLQTQTDLNENTTLIRRAKKKNTLVVLNVSPAVDIAPQVMTNVDYLIFDRPEAEIVAEKEGLNPQDLELFAKAMARKFDLTCIICLGRLGIMSMTPQANDPVMIPSLPIKVSDTVGSVDAFAGVFVAALAADIDSQRALLYASVGSSLTNARPGAQSAFPTLREIEQQLPVLERQVKSFMTLPPHED